MTEISSIRRIIAGIIVFLSAVPLYGRQDSLSQQLRRAIQGVKAQIGIAVIIDGKDTIAINDMTHYPMFSVYKFHQALAVMDYLYRHGLSADTELHITGSDLLPDTYSPLRDKYPTGNIDMSVADLLKYTLQQSDNNACDILFRYIGGPEAVDRYIRLSGIDEFSITATEADMHKHPETAYDNWTTPLSAVKLLEIFLNKNLFSETSRDFIYQTMTTCQTGKNRLPQSLPVREVIIGHKTGSGHINDRGQRTGTNDIGFVILPTGHYYSIAVFIKDSCEDDKTNEQTIATISRIVYDYVRTITSG